jgi:hypothetical protein
MSHGRTNIGKILLQGIVFLLLCGIFAGEVPELLTLVDNATNDFTVCRTASPTSSVPLVTRKHVQIPKSNPNMAAPELFFPFVTSFKKAAIVPSGAFVLHSLLRT